VVAVLDCLGAACFVSGLVLSRHYTQISPTNPNVVPGKIYQHQAHYSIVDISDSEQDAINLTPSAAFVFMLIGIVLDSMKK
jgi:Zn-dependent membrane protease YugP